MLANIYITKHLTKLGYTVNRIFEQEATSGTM